MSWNGQSITLVGMGHYPDTLMVKLGERVIEVYRKEVTGGR